MMVWYACMFSLFEGMIPTNVFEFFLQEINNPETVQKASAKDITITELTSLYVNRVVLETEPDYKLTISIDDVLLPEQPGDYHNFFGKFYQLLENQVKCSHFSSPWKCAHIWSLQQHIFR